MSALTYVPFYYSFYSSDFLLFSYSQIHKRSEARRVRERERDSDVEMLSVSTPRPVKRKADHVRIHSLESDMTELFSRLAYISLGLSAVQDSLADSPDSKKAKLSPSASMFSSCLPSFLIRLSLPSFLSP